jgi:hypothetical protein
VAIFWRVALALSFCPRASSSWAARRSQVERARDEQAEDRDGDPRRAGGFIRSAGRANELQARATLSGLERFGLLRL